MGRLPFTPLTKHCTPYITQHTSQQHNITPHNITPHTTRDTRYLFSTKLEYTRPTIYNITHITQITHIHK